ncbi:MAG: M4 family metallopeptidase, partial [Chloroflexota bacterium]
GPTFTHLPGEGSPAIDSGGAICPEYDQRGTPRPLDAGCDLGSVETAPPIPVCGGVFPAVADTFVDSVNPNQNYGNAASMNLSLDAGRERRLLLGFDLVGLGDQPIYISRATLELPVSQANAVPAGDLAEAFSLVDPWGELTASYNNAPAAQVAYARGGALQQDGLLTLDLTDLVTQWHNAMFNSVAPLDEQSLVLVPANADLDLVVSSRESQAGPRLAIDCAFAPQPYIEDPESLSTLQLTGLNRLESNSLVSARIQTSNGAVTVAEFDLAAPLEAGDEALGKAQWLLNEYADALRLPDPDYTWQLKRRSLDGNRLFFRLLYQGVPLYPSELAVQFAENGHLVGLIGNYWTDVGLPSDPFLDAAQAETLARTALDAAASPGGESQLRYLILPLVGGGSAGIPQQMDIGDQDGPLPQAQNLAFVQAQPNNQMSFLAWEVNLHDSLGSQTVYVDAHSGRLLHRQRNESEAFELDLEHGLDHTPEYLCAWENAALNTNIPWNYDADAIEASSYFKQVYDWFARSFGRDSYDGDGAQIEANIHVDAPKRLAAYMGGWCDMFVLSDQRTYMDVIAHEYTHGLHQAEVNYDNIGMAGALSEALADIFASLIDTEIVEPGELNSGNWVMGEDDPGGPIRDLHDPRAITYYCDVDGLTYTPPDRMSAYRYMPCDNGGVHVNAGILNKFAYLITVGDTFNDRTITGIGTRKVRQLFYNTLVSRWGDNANYYQVAYDLSQEAKSLRRAGFFSTFDVCQVLQGLAAVELGAGDANCDGVEDAQQDSDGDTIYNAYPNGVRWDNCPDLYNKDQANMDGDMFGDVCDNDTDNDGFDDNVDNCRYIPNDQRDIDNDKIGDVCDENSDGDRWPNVQDNCPYIQNNDQKNSDPDRFGDVCDLDQDNDHICGVGGPLVGGKNGVPAGGCDGGAGNLPDDIFVRADNCPLIPNFSQADSDADFVGDACDLCPGIQTRDNGDPDNDKIGNGCDDDDDNDGVLDYQPDGVTPLDNCRLVPNPDQGDYNSNGIGYACDALEQENLRRGLDFITNFRFKPNEASRFPVPVCPECVADTLPNYFQSVVNLQLDVDAAARIVDNRGFTVAKGQVLNGALQLAFRPVSYAAPPIVADLPTPSADLSQASSQATIGPSDTTYFLELFPLENTDLNQDYQVSFTSDDVVAPPVNLAFIYIPLAIWH